MTGSGRPFVRTNRRGRPGSWSIITSVFAFLEYTYESDPSFWVSACSQASLVFHADTARAEPS